MDIASGNRLKISGKNCSHAANVFSKTPARAARREPVRAEPFAGGILLNADDDSARYSHDFDIFHEAKDDVTSRSDRDAKTLDHAGYDPDEEHYVGTWIDSMSATMWRYVGHLGEDGSKLILQTEGPCPMKGGKIVEMREVIHVVDEDHKTFTSSVRDEDGEWQTLMTVKSERAD